MSSVKKLAIRGSLWTIAGYGASQVLRFGNNLILARLLVPDLFGLMALVNVFIIGLHLFSDIGIGQSIIQNKRGDDPVFLNTAWTMQAIRGVVLWIGSILIAYPVSVLYKEPQLLWLIPSVGLTTIINGFNSTSMYTLNRQIALGKLAVFELGGQIISLAVTVIWAYFNPTVWALVSGGLVGAIVQLVWSHRLVPDFSDRFAWDKTSAQSIFSFGKWVFFGTLLTFFATQSDRLILAKYVPLSVLGVYGIAFGLADIPRQVILALSGKVLFPAFSKMIDLPRETFRAKILKNRFPLLLALSVGLTFLVSFGDIVIRFLYKPAFHEAAWMMPIIAMGIWHTSLYSSISPALLAIGKPIYNAQGFLLTFLTISIGLPFAFNNYGMVGAMVVIAFNDFPLYCAILYGLWREKLFCLGQDLKVTAIFLSLLTVTLLSRYYLGWGLPISQILR
ncbi:MAG: oligosaccharide flippase family protein [Coleofasciculaceae cyanobacterium]